MRPSNQSSQGYDRVRGESLFLDTLDQSKERRTVAIGGLAFLCIWVGVEVTAALVTRQSLLTSFIPQSGRHVVDVPAALVEEKAVLDRERDLGLTGLPGATQEDALPEQPEAAQVFALDVDAPPDTQDTQDESDQAHRGRPSHQDEGSEQE